MIPYTRGLNQVATYWSPGRADGFGGQTNYGAPVAIKCRWQGQAKVFKNASGQEAVSTAVVYVDRALEVRGKLLLGTSAESQPPTAAKEIQQIGSSPNIAATHELLKVFL